MPTTVYRVTTSYVGGHGADGWRGPQLPEERTKVPVGRLRDPALFAPWRVMWRPVFPGCHYTFRRLRDPCRALRAPLERIMGIEPTFAAWEAAVLPMNYIRVAPCRNFTGAPLRERRACS